MSNTERNEGRHFPASEELEVEGHKYRYFGREQEEAGPAADESEVEGHKLRYFAREQEETGAASAGEPETEGHGYRHGAGPTEPEVEGHWVRIKAVEQPTGDEQDPAAEVEGHAYKRSAVPEQATDEPETEGHFFRGSI